MNLGEARKDSDESVPRELCCGALLWVAGVVTICEERGHGEIIMHSVFDVGI